MASSMVMFSGSNSNPSFSSIYGGGFPFLCLSAIVCIVSLSPACSNARIWSPEIFPGVADPSSASMLMRDFTRSKVSCSLVTMLNGVIMSGHHWLVGLYLGTAYRETPSHFAYLVVVYYFVRVVGVRIPSRRGAA